MARRTETSINNDLAAALRLLHPAWTEQTVMAESTGVLTEGAGRRPDIVITNESRTGGVILETEFEPARTVEDEARARLGNTFAADGSPVEQVMAVKIPATAKTPGAQLEDLTYSYKVCSSGTDGQLWFPAHGWIEGTLADLAGFVETVAVSPRQLAEGVNVLEAGVRQAANIIRHGMEQTYRGGLDDEDVHARFLEQVLIGCDIMPAATHLTAAQLTAAHPTVTFGNTRIHTMPYGEHNPGSGSRTFIGSLELLDNQAVWSLLGTGAATVTGTSEVGDAGERRIDLPDRSLDLVIMNPPFTRPTNHEVSDVPVPSFAGFETSDLEQREMSKRLGWLRRKLEHEPAGHGNAGLASNFVDLTHTKVKPGGTIAPVELTKPRRVPDTDGGHRRASMAVVPAQRSLLREGHRPLVHHNVWADRTLVGRLTPATRKVESLRGKARRTPSTRLPRRQL